MNEIISTRSVLHALAPKGVGTPEVESLTSYFCRLAHSHGMTSRQLASWVLERFGEPVLEDFKWFRRNFSSMTSETEQWSAWLSELTGVGELDRLTLVPWQYVVAGSGFSPHTDRWCSACFKEDIEQGVDTYLRLAWDVASVSVCPRHKVELTSLCPHCARSNIRHRATSVVPGYCTACGGFLGDAVSAPATPEALWVARQVGLMLSAQPTLEKGGTTEVLKQVIEKMAGGKAGTFAKRLGLSKSGVWHWVTKDGLPTLLAWLRISLHTGLSMDRLFGGNLEGWRPPLQPEQLPMFLPDSPRNGIRSNRLDWDEIRADLREILKLPEPITLDETCQRLGVDHKQLYLRANIEARAISQRFLLHRMEVKAERESALRQRLEVLLQERLESGYEGISARDVRAAGLAPDLKAVRNSYALIRQVREDRNG